MAAGRRGHLPRLRRACSHARSRASWFPRLGSRAFVPRLVVPAPCAARCPAVLRHVVSVPRGPCRPTATSPIALSHHAQAHAVPTPHAHAACPRRMPTPHAHAHAHAHAWHMAHGTPWTRTCPHGYRTWRVLIEQATSSTWASPRSAARIRIEARLEMESPTIGPPDDGHHADAAPPLAG